MAETQTEFQRTGGAGQGPAGSMPAGSRFTDENTGDPRPDLPAPAFEYENIPLVMESNG